MYLKQSDTRASSDFLKGIAIFSVLANHYLNLFPDINSGGFANSIISIFFFLSGYGIFSSIEAKTKDSSFSFDKMVLFLGNRATKVFPLYWLALCTQSIISGHWYSPLTFLGFEAEGHYWFISAIIQCYLLTPALYIALQRNQYFSIIICTLILTVSKAVSSQNPYLEFLAGFFHLTESPYLEIYFLHTYIYFAGMCLKKFGFRPANDHNSLIFKHKNLILLFLAASYTIYAVLEKFLLPLPILGNILILMLASIFTMFSQISWEGSILASICFLGRASFPVYLFHMSYYISLVKMGILPNWACFWRTGDCCFIPHVSESGN